jgi:hypothetical protein
VAYPELWHDPSFQGFVAEHFSDFKKMIPRDVYEEIVPLTELKQDEIEDSLPNALARAIYDEMWHAMSPYMHGIDEVEGDVGVLMGQALSIVMGQEFEEDEDKEWWNEYIRESTTKYLEKLGRTHAKRFITDPAFTGLSVAEALEKADIDWDELDLIYHTQHHAKKETK